MKALTRCAFAAALAVLLVFSFLEHLTVLQLERSLAARNEELASGRAQLKDLAGVAQSNRRVIDDLKKERSLSQSDAEENASLKTALMSATTNNADAWDLNDPFVKAVRSNLEKVAELNQRLQADPSKNIPEIGLLTVDDWLKAARDAKLDNDAETRQTLRELREIAKEKLPLGSALYSFTRANNGELPTDLSQLQPYFKSPIDDSILSRYQIVRSGNATGLPPAAWVVVERHPVDSLYDSRAKFGIGMSTIIDTGLGTHGDPDDSSYDSQAKAITKI